MAYYCLIDWAECLLEIRVNQLKEVRGKSISLITTYIMEEGLKDEHVQQHQLPPGFRFHPTDEELIAYYLTRKTTDANFDARAIADVDLNKCEPWDLPGNIIPKH